MQNAIYDEMARGENGSGDTSVDSRMEETPANYNIPNQRFDQEYDDYDVIPEEGDEGDAAHRRRRQRGGNDMGLTDPEFAAAKRRRKKKKKKPKKNTVEYLDPTDREIEMANAYGGIAKGQLKRPGIKYDKERLQKRNVQTPGANMGRQTL